MRRMPCLHASLAACLALAGCAYTTVPPGFVESLAALDPVAFTCCAEPEKFYPEPLVRLTIGVTDAGLGPAVTDAIFGQYEAGTYPGSLSGKPGVQAAVLARLRPFDMVFIADKSYAFGKLIPGRFTHSYIYTGTEADLRALGLWDLPEVAAHHGEIRAGRHILEAVAPVARLGFLSKGLEVDAAAILRPALTPAQRRAAARAAFGSLGTPYDFTFNVDTPARLSCTELIDVAYPQLDLTVRAAYGQKIILPDDVVAQAIRGEGLRVVGYVAGTGAGFEWRNQHSLMADIAAYWGLPR